VTQARLLPKIPTPSESKFFRNARRYALPGRQSLASNRIPPHWPLNPPVQQTQNGTPNSSATVRCPEKRAFPCNSIKSPKADV
jgi:hypothetical protein